MTMDKTEAETEARQLASQRLLEAAMEPGLPPWLRQVLETTAADPAILESRETAATAGPYNFIYFH